MVQQETVRANIMITFMYTRAYLGFTARRQTQCYSISVRPSPTRRESAKPKRMNIE